MNKKLYLKYVSRIYSLKVSNFLKRLSIGPQLGSSRTVELEVDIGAAAFDYQALQETEV